MLKRTLLILALLLVPTLAFAGYVPPEIPFSPTAAGTISILPYVGADAEMTQSSVQDQGIYTLRSLAINIYFIIKYVLIAAAVLFLSISGAILVGSPDSDKALSTEKESIKYVFLGLIMLLFLDPVITTFFGQADESGTIFSQALSGGASSITDAKASGLTEEFLALADFLMSLATVIGVLIIVVSSLRILVGAVSANEKDMTGQRKVALNVLLGLAIMALANTIITNVIFGVAGYSSSVGVLVDAQAAVDEIMAIGNYVLGFFSLIATLIILYASFLMVTAMGNDAQITKAKDMLVSAAIALVLIVSSYAIVATFTAPLG